MTCQVLYRTTVEHLSLVGVQIHHTLPVNKGEVVWTMHAEDVANLGETLTTGVYTTKRTVSAAGSEHPAPKYFQTNLGCELTALTAGHEGDTTRFISGNPLTGTHAGFSRIPGYAKTMNISYNLPAATSKAESSVRISSFVYLKARMSLWIRKSPS